MQHIFLVWPGWAIILLLLLGAESIEGQQDVIINGRKKTLNTQRFANADHTSFVSIKDLANLLELQSSFDRSQNKAVLYLADTEVEVTAMNPFVAIGDRIVQMPVDALAQDGKIFVPSPYFVNLIAPHFSGALKMEDRHRIPEGDSTKNAKEQNKIPEDKSTPAEPEAKKPKPGRFNITGVSADEKANGTLIRIKTSRGFDDAHVSSRVTNGWLYVDVYGGVVDKSIDRSKSVTNLIKKVVLVQLSQMAQLSFKLRLPVSSRKIYANGASNEILVSITTEETIAPDILKSLENERRKWLIDTVIIDPGHGGIDPGAIGHGKLYEKKVTLAIARELKKLLAKDDDIKVIMTRDDDRFVPLKSRTTLANNEQGKLFISIHANSNRNRKIRGLTTYFLGQAKTEEALEVAKRENAVINYEKDKDSYANFEDEGYILLSLAQNEYQKDSEELAAMVQDDVSGRTRVRNRGVRQAGFSVLVGASMPSILVEVAFISNKQEAQKLKSRKFQKKVAEGLYASIRRFKDKYENVE